MRPNAPKGDPLISCLLTLLLITLTHVRVCGALSFPAPEDMLYGDVVALMASDDTGEPVVYAVVGAESTGSGTIDGNELTATGVGTLTISATVTETGESLQHTLNVSQRPLTVYAQSASKEQGDANPALSAGYAGFVEGDTEAVLDSAPTLDTTVDVSSTVGDYEITISGGSDDNYSMSGYFAGTFVVKPTPGRSQVDQTISFPDIGALTYGDTVQLNATSSRNLDISYEVVAGPGTIIGAELTATGVGTILVRATQIGTNRVQIATPVESAAIVSPATLTVTAVDAYRNINDPDPSFLITYSGFQFEDTGSSLAVAPTVITDALADSTEGVYTLTPSGGSDPNYYFNYIEGQFFLNELQAQVLTLPTINDINYGDVTSLAATVDSGLSLTYTLIASQSSGSVEINGEDATATRAGEVTIEVSQEGDATFNPVKGQLTFNILPLPLVVTADDQFRRYKKADPVFTLSYTGFLPGDAAADLDVAPTATTDADINSLDGDYTITPSGGSDPNYTFSYVNGTLTINRKVDQVITFESIPTQEIGNQLTFTATSDSGLPVTYFIVAEQSNATGTFDPVEPNKLTLDTRGTLTVKAEQAGDDTYNPAYPIIHTFRILERTSEPMVWIVDHQGTGQFPTLEEAVLHSVVRDGDTIIIRPGTYYHEEELDVNKSLTITSDGNGEVRIVKAGQPPKVSKTTNPVWFNTNEYRYAIRITADGVTFQNLTLAAWQVEEQGFGWGIGVGASNFTIDNCIFDSLNIRSGIVVYDNVSDFTLTNSTIQGYYYEPFMRGGVQNLTIENNTFEQSQWYGGCMYFDDRHAVSGSIKFNYFVYTPGTAAHPEDFNQSGLGFDTIAIFSSQMPSELLIQHNTFAWESVDQSNDHNIRGQATAIHVKEFPGLQSENLNILDNIFYGYETIVQDGGLKQRPVFHPTGKHGGALEFDGEQAFASFLHPTFEFGTRGSLSMWVKVSNENKRNTLLLGPQGENLAAWNLRNANDKSFEFSINNNAEVFFYPNYSDDSDIVKRAFVRTVSLNLEGSWQHLAFSWDKDVNGGEGRIYYGGFEQNYDIISAAAGEARTHADPQLDGLWLNPSITTNGLFYMGRDPNDENLLDSDPVETRTYQGLIDEVILFNEAIPFNTQGNAQIREEAFSNNLTEYSDQVIAYWTFDADPGTDTLPDELGNVDLFLGKGWPGFGVVVPDTSHVTNNLFFQNGYNATRTDQTLLGDDNILDDPLFLEGDGGVLSRYALKNGSPAIRAATNRVDNIGAKQPDPQTIIFVVDDRFNNKVYGDTIQLEARTDSGLEVAFEVDEAQSTGTGVVVGNILTITGVGDIFLRARQDGDANFKIADPVEYSFTALKKPLQVTPVATSIGTGDSIPGPTDFVLDITGFVVPTDAFTNPDNRADLDQEPTAQSPNAVVGVSGDYQIIPEGGLDNNYTFVYNQGTLTINNKQTQTVTFDPIADLVYGEEAVLNASTTATDPAVQITFSVLSSDSTGGGIIFQENAENRFLATQVGEITIRAQATETATFNASPPIDHTFQISKRPLEVIAENAERPYADANPEFTWVKTKGDIHGLTSSDSAGVSVGRTGDVYWAGTFEGDIRFPATTLQEATVYQAEGTPDLFLARYDNTGKLIWHRHVGHGVGGQGSGFSPVSVATDINNNVFVIGTFNGSVTLGTVAMTSLAGTGDIFILKYTETGNFSWASKVTGVSSQDELEAVAAVVNNEGATYIIGEFKGTVDFGPTALTSEYLNSDSSAERSRDIFIGRFNVDNGSPEWVNQVGGPQDDEAGGVALDENQRPVITGSFREFLKLDADFSLAGSTVEKIFLIKYDGTGERIWSLQTGGENTEDLQVNHLSSGEDGEMVITGTFSNEIRIKSNKDPNVSNGGTDAFYAMYDTFGSLVWWDTIGGTGDDTGLVSEVSQHGFTRTIGNFTDSMELNDLMDPQDDSLPLTLNALNGGQDLYIVNYDAIGIQRWARQTLGAGQIDNIALAIDEDLNSYISGSFAKVADRNPDVHFPPLQANALGPRDAFLVQLKRDVPTLRFTYGEFFGGRISNGNVLHPEDNEIVIDKPPVAVIFDDELDEFGNRVVKNDLWLEDAGSGPYLIEFIEGEDDNYEFVYQTGEFSITRATQRINFFQEFIDVKYQDVIPLTAIATSGLPVEYTIESGKNIAIVIDNDHLEIIHVGLVVVRANQPGDDNYLPASPQEQAFLVGKADQVISWTQDFLAVKYGDLLGLEAISTSGLKVRYEIVDPDTSTGTAEIIDNSTIQFTSVGSGTIRAIQRGSEVFTPADSVELQWVAGKAKLTVWPVNKVSQVGTVDNVYEIEYLDADFRLNDDSRVIENPPVASSIADDSSPPGLYTIVLTGGSDENYEFDRRTGTLRISEKAPQKITFNQDFTGWTYGETYELIAETSSGLPVTFSVISGEATLNGNFITLEQAGLIVVEVSQAGNTQFEEAPDVFGIIDANRRSLDIIADPQTRYVGEPNPVFTWQAVGLLDGDTLEEEVLTLPNVPPSLSTAASENSLASIYPIVVTPGYSENYEHNPVNGTLTVLDSSKGEQEIVWDQDLSALVFGEVVTLSAYTVEIGDAQQTPIDDVEVRYNVISGSDAVEIIGSTLTVIGVGDFTIRAIQRGNDQWNPANEVFKSGSTSRLTQTITWDQVFDPALKYGNQDTLTATASSGLEVSFSIAQDSLGTATIDNNLIIPQNSGEIRIVASQGGNENYEPAPSITRSFTVDQATVTISVANVVRREGENNPTFVPVYDFPLATDTPQSLTRQAEATTAATPASPAGVYTITYSTLAQDDRFIFNHVPGRLTIIDPDLQVQTIDFPLDTAGLEVGDFVSLQATASSGLPVEYVILTGSDSIEWVEENSQFVITKPGTITIQAIQTGNETYAPASSDTVTISVPLVEQTIFWEQTIADPKYGDTVQLNATSSSGHPVRYRIPFGSGSAKIEGNEITFTTTGPITIEAYQDGDIEFGGTTFTKDIVVGKAPLTIWPEDAFRIFLDPNPAFVLVYNESDFKFGDSASDIDPPRASTLATIDTDPGEYPITLNGGSAANYDLILLQGILTIVDGNKQFQFIDFDQIGSGFDFTVGDYTRLTADATSGFPVEYEVLEGANLFRILEDDDSVMRFIKAGKIMIKATQDGGTKTIINDSGVEEEVEYLPAPAVIKTFTVSGKEQEIIWDQDLSSLTYGETIQLLAYATSGLTVSFDLLLGEADFVGNEITLTKTGEEIVIQASQGGDDFFLAAPTLVRQFKVNKIPVTIKARNLEWSSGSSMPTLRYDILGLPDGVNPSSIFVHEPKLRTDAITTSAPGLYTITVSGAFSENYTFEYIDGALLKTDPGRQDQTIVWNQVLDNVDLGDQVILAAKSSASDSFTIFYDLLSGEDNAEILPPNVFSVSRPDSFTIQASHPGNFLYNPAVLDRTIVVEKEAQEIIWDQTFTDVTFGSMVDLLAESIELRTPGRTIERPTGLDITYTVIAGEAHIENGSTLVVNAPGRIRILATQDGDDNWLPADSVVREFTAGKGTLVAYAEADASQIDDPVPNLRVRYEVIADGDLGGAVDASVFGKGDILPLPVIMDEDIIDLSVPGRYTITFSSLGRHKLYDIIHIDGDLVRSLTNQPPHSISWDQNNKSDFIYGETMELTATTSTGANLIYEIIRPLDPTLYSQNDLDGNMITLRAAGELIVRVYAEGSGSFNAAPAIYQFFDVKKRTLKAVVQDAFSLPGKSLPFFKIDYDITTRAPWDQESHINMNDILDKPPVAVTEAPEPTVEGVYAVLVVGGEDSNYTFEYGSGVLTVQAYQDLWAHYPVEEDGWKTVPWFGRIYDDPDSHWIYHECHGWMYGLGFTEKSIWFWEEVLGWVWTGEDAYPWMYREGIGIWREDIYGTFEPRWYWYADCTKDPRIFYDSLTGTWTTLLYDDADGDGMQDIWEVDNFGTTDRDGTQDKDRDGLSDIEEYRRNLNPNHPDTDGDGFTDSWEVFNNFDALDPNTPNDLLNP